MAIAIASFIGTTAFADIDVSKLPPAATKKGVTYATDIKPLLEASCIRCHGAERPKAGLRLDSLENVLKGSKEGPVVVAKDSVKSHLLIAVSQLDPELSMPPKPRPGRGGPGGPPGTPPGGNFVPPKPLTPEQVGLIRAWIDQGAK